MQRENARTEAAEIPNFQRPGTTPRGEVRRPAAANGARCNLTEAYDRRAACLMMWSLVLGQRTVPAGGSKGVTGSGGGTSELPSRSRRAIPEPLACGRADLNSTGNPEPQIWLWLNLWLIRPVRHRSPAVSSAALSLLTDGPGRW